MFRFSEAACGRTTWARGGCNLGTRGEANLGTLRDHPAGNPALGRADRLHAVSAGSGPRSQPGLEPTTEGKTMRQRHTERWVRRLLGAVGAIGLVTGLLCGSASAADQGWLPYFSDETSGALCNFNNRVTKVDCGGSYCDNITLYCSEVAAGVEGSQWYWDSKSYSDEATGGRACTFNGQAGIIVGSSCNYDYCDNMFLACDKIDSGTISNCSYTQWFSEEGGHQVSWNLPNAAVHAYCSGDYCDNMRYIVCSVS